MSTPTDAPGTPRRRNPRGEGARLREQLLTAAVELLGELGDEARVSVRAVATRAGVSPTALYLHFPDRNALVDAAVDRCFADFNATLRAAAAAGGTDPRARLRAMADAYLDLAARRPALYAVLFTTRREMTPRAGAAADAPGTDREDAFVALAGLVVACGAPEGEAYPIAGSLWAALHGYALLRADRPKRTWAEPGEYVRRTLDAHLGPEPT